jgi:hypothetical protein
MQARTRVHTRSAVIGSSIALALAIGGCAAAPKGSAITTYPLVVDNRSDFEVVVYAMPTVTGNGIRIGNARTFSTTRMSIPRNALQSSDRLVLRLSAIGANAAPWTMPATNIQDGETVKVEIHADPSGALSHSVLYIEGSTSGHPWSKDVDHR